MNDALIDRCWDLLSDPVLSRGLTAQEYSAVFAAGVIAIRSGAQEVMGVAGFDDREGGKSVVDVVAEVGVVVNAVRTILMHVVDDQLRY